MALRNTAAEEDDEELPPPPILGMEDEVLDASELQSWTVTQLRQQLRLRGLKVSGKKQELIQRLVNPIKSQQEEEEENVVAAEAVDKPPSKAVEFARAQGKTLVDVSAYVDEEDQCKETKSSREMEKDNDDSADASSSKSESNNPEVWGEEARMVEDYEGRSMLVDGMSRTVMEFTGSNQTKVQAYVVASRAALGAYLSGAGSRSAANATEKVVQLQQAREAATQAEPAAAADDNGMLEDNDALANEVYGNVTVRDYGDYGIYSPTGAQVSAAEVQGVLLLSDVRGFLHPDTVALAEKVAFECQPVVVMIPDLFAGQAWDGNGTTADSFNSLHQTYEEWRSAFAGPPERVHVDISAAAATLRNVYGVASVAVFGTCFGGGRALQVTLGPHVNFDVDGRVAPPPVNPAACIAWYPTRYNLTAPPPTTNEHGATVAVMALFAEEDTLDGARPSDAAELATYLEADSRIKDSMVKVFANQTHGFAHAGLAARQESQQDTEEDRFLREEFGGPVQSSFSRSGDAEVAHLLSTAFLETYTRVFLPTVGTAVRDDATTPQWTSDPSHLVLPQWPEPKDGGPDDMRQRLQKQADEFESPPLPIGRLHPSAAHDEVADSFYGPQDKIPQPSIYGVTPDDDEATMFDKMIAAIDRGDIEFTPGFGGDAFIDDASEAYW